MRNEKLDLLKTLRDYVDKRSFFKSFAKRGVSHPLQILASVGPSSGTRTESTEEDTILEFLADLFATPPANPSSTTRVVNAELLYHCKTRATKRPESEYSTQQIVEEATQRAPTSEEELLIGWLERERFRRSAEPPVIVVVPQCAPLPNPDRKIEKTNLFLRCRRTATEVQRQGKHLISSRSLCLRKF